MFLKFSFSMFLTILINIGWGQSNPNRFSRISKSEFRTLKKEKSRFAPDDIKIDTVIVIQYSFTRLQQMEHAAIEKAYSRYITDTLEHTINLLYTKRQQKEASKISFKLATLISSEASKRGLKTIVISEKELETCDCYMDKYWIITDSVCSYDVNHDKLHTSYLNIIYDPSKQKIYEYFLPTNYSIFDLLE